MLIHICLDLMMVEHYIGFDMISVEHFVGFEHSCHKSHLVLVVCEVFVDNVEIGLDYNCASVYIGLVDNSIVAEEVLLFGD